MNALVAGRNSDPFGVLGPQPIETPAGRRWLVRILQPRAVEAHLLWGGETAPLPMKKIRPEGVYEVELPLVSDLAPAPSSYRIRCRMDYGAVVEGHDAYAFPYLLSEFDLYLMGEGRHYDTYDKLGAHIKTVDGVSGVHFAVWAPSARRVSVVGDFNGWDGRIHPMRTRGSSGIWELFLPELGEGAIYKYEIIGPRGEMLPLKADPYGFFSELRPNTGSVVARLDKHNWGDGDWMTQRTQRNWLQQPISVYEVHLGSWRRMPEDQNRWLTYLELADQLIPYVKDLGYTHIELLPVMEHPFDGSWGYQTLGYFAATSRYGTPTEFMAFVDRCHQAGIGVLLDWTPAHFPRDSHGLSLFDGTHLYEHSDPRQGTHPDWGTLVYNYGRNEVQNFLISNALFWLDKYHIDGLRVDAVASMLYLDYSRKEGEWIPNRYGGRENLDAIDFLKRMNEVAYLRFPGVLTIAEESTAWPSVSRPTYLGGLGFSLKWNMGWMNDTLRYITKDPVYRKYEHGSLTFSMIYAFSENFVLPLSHDEVVHGKRALLDKMPGDLWQKFANLRLLYAYMYGHPGKKLLFMGDELAQWREWNQDESLDWHMLQWRDHQGILKLVCDLNALCNTEASLHQVDFDWQGYEWLELHDWENSVLAFLRRAKDPNDSMVVICNFTPVVREQYRIGVPTGGYYREALNTDAGYYAGSNIGNEGGVWAVPEPYGGRPYHLSLRLPPLAALYLKTPPVA